MEKLPDFINYKLKQQENVLTTLNKDEKRFNKISSRIEKTIQKPKEELLLQTGHKHRIKQEIGQIIGSQQEQNKETDSSYEW